MPTIVGLRRRGYTPESIQLFAERIGVTKSDSWIDYSTLERLPARRPGPEGPARDGRARPGQAGAHQLGRGDGRGTCWTTAPRPLHPHHPERGQRDFKIGDELWIERDDFEEVPPKGYFRLFPGNKVRLKYGHVIECTGCTKDADGNVTEVQADPGARHQERHAGRERHQGQGRHHLGGRGRWR